MKFTARVTTKQTDPIFNGHRDPRKTVLFFCEITVNDEVICDSGFWCKTEEDAIKEAKAKFSQIETTVLMVGYKRTDFEWRVDGWGQLRVRTFEDAARVHENVKDII